MKTYFFRWPVLFLLAVGIATSGCAGHNGNHERDYGASRSSSSDEEAVRMIHYEHYLRGLRKDLLDVEHAGVEKAYAERGTEDLFFNYVILLTLPDTDFQDDNRAIELLNGYLSSNRDMPPGSREYAEHLLAVVREREALHERVRALEQQLQQERRHSRELKEKLEALKKIEKSIMNRQDIPEVSSQ